MRRLIFILLAFVLAGVVASAQEIRPLVLFIVDEDLGTASPVSTEVNSVATLAEIFTNLGADVLPVKLDQPLPDIAQAVVLAQPMNTLPVESVARLWTYIERGHHLLLAIDPLDYNGVRADPANASFPSLLNSDYGIGLQDTFLVERWFTPESLSAGLEGSLTQTYAPAVLHPVLQPLRDYGLPIATWGARTIRVEPFGVNSIALPLLYTDTAYGETNSRSLTGGDNAPLLELNIGTDLLGHLNVASLARNIKSGSYVVMLGDSQMLEDGFGLLVDSQTALPQHVGNRILMERLAALLLDLPVEEWPGLPAGFTWLALNGDASDWDTALPAVSDEEDEAPTAYNIQQVRAFHNDSYVYLLVETSGTPPADVRLTLDISAAETEGISISAQSGQVMVIAATGETVVEDAALAVGQVIEVRLPLRVTGLTEISIDLLCLYEGAADATAEAQDCLSQPVEVTPSEERDPLSLRFGQTLSVTINDINRGAAGLRDVPDLFAPIKALVSNGTVLAAIGRDESGEWINVQNATTGGWVEAFTVIANGDLSALPVVP